jgi:hypothetical protein
MRTMQHDADDRFGRRAVRQQYVMVDVRSVQYCYHEREHGHHEPAGAAARVEQARGSRQGSLAARGHGVVTVRAFSAERAAQPRA